MTDVTDALDQLRPGPPGTTSAAFYRARPGATPTWRAHRRIDLDLTTNAVFTAWRTWQTAEQLAIGVDPSSRMFTDGHGETIRPHAISPTFERIARRADASPAWLSIRFGIARLPDGVS